MLLARPVVTAFPLVSYERGEQQRLYDQRQREYRDEQRSGDEWNAQLRHFQRDHHRRSDHNHGHR